MNSAAALLPEGFAALEPFVDTWAIEEAHDRMQRRLDSSEAERTAFFEAGKDLVPAALELLDKKSLGEYDDRENRLMLLVLGLAHVAQAVEIQRDEEPKHAKYARFITITRASADDNP